MPWWIFRIQVAVWKFFSPCDDDNGYARPMNEVAENMLMWELDKRIQREKDRKTEIVRKRLDREYGEREEYANWEAQNPDNL